MAREQGDELGDEVVYTHPEYGERPAYTPADVVNLEARGWKPKGKSRSTSTSRSKASGDSGGAAAASA